MRNNLYKFFDKTGNALNLSESLYSSAVLKNIPAKSYTTLSGSLYFPKISTGLIESNQVFLLQDVIKNIDSFKLINIIGKVSMNTGDTRLYGINTKFTTDLVVGNIIVLKNKDYIVQSIQDDTTVILNNVPGSPFSNELIYKKEFFFYSFPIATDDCESITCELTDSSNFFLYNIDYSDNTTPWIVKNSSIQYIPNQVNTTIFPGSDKPVYSNAETSPLNLNIGFSSVDEGIYQTTLKINKTKTYTSVLETAPSLNNNQYYLVFLGSSIFDQINADSIINLISSTASIKLDIIDCRYSAGYSILVVEYSNDISSLINGFNFDNYSLVLKNVQTISTLSLYAESESEDERFITLLSNFGKKIDFNDEFIFRDSDINEVLPNFKVLNIKRKELLLEGDNIYPYIGSYKALLNAINFFGYNDIKIKEYFLNTDIHNKDLGKYFQVQIPRNADERSKLQSIWKHLPSTTHKKTSTFGLFYDINKLSGNYDSEGIPEVIDAFDYTQEEVLIKLFGLKNILKEKFLPLNAKIVDITGEGIYFRPISVNIWNDNLTHFEIDLGKKINVDIFPSKESYISDIRIIDSFYQTKFLKQGIIGFIETNPLGELYGNSTLTINDISVNSLGNYIGGKLQAYDEVKNNNFSFFPPSINTINYNENLSFIRSLEDTENTIVGAPILIEAIFDLSWDDSKFTWNDLAKKELNGNEYNMNVWTWDKIAIGQNIEVQFKVNYLGSRTFVYDSGRNLVEDHLIDYTVGNSTIKRILDTTLLPYDGLYEVTVIFYDLHNTSSINTQTYTVNKRELEITSLYKAPAPNLTWDDLDASWDTYNFSFTNTVQNDTTWNDTICTWDDYSSASVLNQKLYTQPVNVSILNIDRNLENITFNNTNILSNTSFLTFTRETAEFILIDKEIPNYSIIKISDNEFSIQNFNESIELATRLILTKNREHGDFTRLNSNVYYYLDVVSYSNNNLIVKTESFLADEIDNFIQAGYDFYITTGIFSGTYSIEVKSITTDTNGNTLVRFIDKNKELFFIDGNFTVEINSYDINTAIINSDYKLSKQLQNIDVDYNHIINDYNDLHNHGTIFNGFIIPFVKPNGMIKINEGTEFYFSDNIIIDSNKIGLDYAVNELINSSNLELQKFNYSVIPSIGLTLKDINNIDLTTNINYTLGTGVFSGNPINLKIPAILKPIFNSTIVDDIEIHNLVDIQIINAGAGYKTIPNYTITDPLHGNTKTILTLDIINGSIIIPNFTIGINYSLDTIIEVEPPIDWFPGADHLFFDNNWVKINSINNNLFYFNPLVFKPAGSIVINNTLIPYKWHTQQFGKNNEILNEYYYAIHAVSKTPNQETTSYIRTENGVYGEWKQNKFISHTLSINNDLIYNNYNINYSLNDMFDRLKFNNFSYPFKDTDSIFQSNILSKQSSQDSAYLNQDLLTWENAIVSTHSQTVNRNTGITFTYSGSIIPGKYNPIWSLFYEDQLISQTISKNMFWNFTKPGNYSISLYLKDGNGNEYNTIKNAFVKVS